MFVRTQRSDEFQLSGAGQVREGVPSKLSENRPAPAVGPA